MKTYKTWEMIKKLTENPEKKFSLILNKANMVGFDKETGRLVWEQGSRFELFNSTLKQEWEEVKKPVDFMTAFRAYREGKTILSVSKARGKYRYRPYQDFKNDFHEDDIASDEWYIED